MHILVGLSDLNHKPINTNNVNCHGSPELSSEDIYMCASENIYVCLYVRARFSKPETEQIPGMSKL